jgi:hypothetical protein
MSEGRLAPVRETDRHAALVAGVAAAICSAATFAVLYGMNIRPDLGPDGGSTPTSFAFFVGIALVFGLATGCVEGAIAARAARRAADRFAPLGAFARRVFVCAALVNVTLSAVAVSILFSGSDRIAAEICALLVAIFASSIGAALFGWSHALDWPHVPDYLFTGAPQRRAPAQQSASEGGAQAIDVTIAAGRDEVVNEGRSRRSTSKVDDEVWQELQDLITGK